MDTRGSRMTLAGCIAALSALAAAGCASPSPLSGRTVEQTGQAGERSAPAAPAFVAPAAPAPVPPAVPAPVAPAGSPPAAPVEPVPVAMGVTGQAAIEFFEALKVKSPALAGRLDYLRERIMKMTPNQLAALKYLRWRPHKFADQTEIAAMVKKWLDAPKTFADSLEMDMDLVVASTPDSAADLAGKLPKYVQI